MGNAINVEVFLNLREPLERLFNQKMKIALSYKLRKIMKTLDNTYGDLYASFQGKNEEEIAEYARKNSISVDVEKISLTELEENDIIISPIELELFSWMIKDDLQNNE